MIAENFQPQVTRAAALAVMTASLLMSACGGSGNTASRQAATQSGANSPVVTAQTACATLSGKAIGGATLTTAVIPASGTAPTYCKVNGTLAPALNFEIRPSLSMAERFGGFTEKIGLERHAMYVFDCGAILVEASL